MAIEGENKMVKPAATKMESVRYVGHQVGVHTVVDGRTHRFPWNKVVDVPLALAKELLKQPEKFQPGSGPARKPEDAGKPCILAKGK